MIKLSLFKYTGDGTPENEFTHYGSNDGENFWDTCQQTTRTDGKVIETEGDAIDSDIESPLDAYLAKFDGYEGKELTYTRFQRAVIGSMVVEINSSDLKTSPTLFFKVEEVDDDGNALDIPMYYYSKGVTFVSDQNLDRTSYRVECNLDAGATYGCYYHSYMKDCTEYFDFMNKMCDRYLFYKTGAEITDDDYLLTLNKDCTPVGDGPWTGTIDYTVQTYLMRVGKYETPLYYNDEGNHLTFENGMTMNGVSTTDGSAGVAANYPMSAIHCNFTTSPDPDTETAPSYYHIEGSDHLLQNTNTISGTALTVMSDDRFNSNGKYRYLVTKFGNNFCGASDELKPTSADITAAKGMSSTKIQDAVLNVLQNTNVSKQCITTQKVIGQGTDTEVSETAKRKIHLNGESICIVPFPNAVDRAEEMYLYYLNSHDKGIVLGNGSVLGMCINDIPPTILAAALRKYNNNDTVAQTLGDKLSLRQSSATNKCPVDITSLRLIGNGDGSDHKITTATTNILEDSGGETSGASSLGYKPKSDIIGKAGGYCAYAPSGFTHSFRSFGFDQGIAEYDRIANKHFFIVYYDGGTQTSTEYNHGSNLMVEGDSTISETTVIPPPESKADTYYIEFASAYSSLKGFYLNEDSKHYFPAIFHDFSYIPVTIAKKGYECGSDYFTPFENMLNNNDSLCETNTPDSHPLFFGPNLGKGVYYIDAKNNIQLGADKIDGKKFVANDGEIDLNVSFNTMTNYKLDIGDLRNDKYPMTRNGLELISQDTTCFPFTCEAFNNGYQENMTSIETSKASMQVSNDYALKNARIQGGTGFGGSAFGGTGTGAGIGTKILPGPGTAIGAAIGAGMGLISGGIGVGTSIAGAKLAIEEAEKQGQLEGSQKLGNLAGSPTQMSQSGGTTGSLIYSPNAENDKEDVYDLFRRYSVPELVKQQIGHDISMNGEEYLSQCPYINYNNRKNFNIIKANLADKQYVAMNGIKEHMFNTSPLFSQEDMIESYFLKCKSGLRLFKCQYDKEKIPEIIEGNVEMKLQGALNSNN